MANTNQLEVLTKENVRLYEENMKLKLMLGTSTTRKAKSTKKNNDTKSTTKSNTKTANKNTKSAANKTKTTKKAAPKVKKPEKINVNKETLSKFQQEREAKKAIVLNKRNEKVSVPEIAKLINQSEPTVRNYIRELRVEGKLAK